MTLALRSLTPLALASALLLAALGCSSSETGMTKEEQGAFKGGGSGERSPESKKAIGDFAENYRRTHPSSGGPPGNPKGGPPASAGPGAGSSGNTP